jgi:acetyl-CoA carboxylase biotin carboxyl carrier protein
MDLNEIQDLIKFVAKSGVNEVEIEQKDFKITIKSDYLAQKKGGIVSEQQQIVQHVPVSVPAQPIAVAAPPVQAAPPVTETTPAAKTPETPAAAEDDDSKYITVNSPMIGTFYRASSPDKPPFVSVGDNIKPGDVICIVEAMKLFNEIEAEISGKIVKVLADDTTPIEYDQPLFLIDPS